MSGRRGAGPLRGMSALLLLRAVAAASLLAVAHALRVQRTTDDLVANAGEVLHPAAPHEHDRVLLQVVPDARNVGGDLDAVAGPDAGHLAQRRVGLLRGGGINARADATPLRAALERRRLRLAQLRLPALADQLLDRRHRACLPSASRPHVCQSLLAAVLLFSSSLVRAVPAPAVGRVARRAEAESNVQPALR